MPLDGSVGANGECPAPSLGSFSLLCSLVVCLLWNAPSLVLFQFWIAKRTCHQEVRGPRGEKCLFLQLPLCPLGFSSSCAPLSKTIMPSSIPVRGGNSYQEGPVLQLPAVSDPRVVTCPYCPHLFKSPLNCLTSPFGVHHLFPIGTLHDSLLSIRDSVQVCKGDVTMKGSFQELPLVQMAGGGAQETQTGAAARETARGQAACSLLC